MPTLVLLGNLSPLFRSSTLVREPAPPPPLPSAPEATTRRVHARCPVEASLVAEKNEARGNERVGGQRRRRRRRRRRWYGRRTRSPCKLLAEYKVSRLSPSLSARYLVPYVCTCSVRITGP